MKKIISVLLIIIICMTPASAFAVEEIEYSKVYNRVAVRLTPVDSPEAVLIIAQYKSGKLINMECINIAQPDEVYVSSSKPIEEGIVYKYFVYDNINCENELFDSIEITTESREQLFLAEYEGNKFQRID